MKKIQMLLAISFLVFYSILPTLSAPSPVCTQGDMWEFVINNAYRIAEEYSADHNPSSTFASASKNFSFLKQVAGDYEGKYLLLITNKHGNDTSFAVLLPLFDPDKPSTNLDDSKPLWKVISAKLNGRPY